MKLQVDTSDKTNEPDEEQLDLLIKQAGSESRVRRQEALTRHFAKLQNAIAEAMALSDNSSTS